jgi:hypothetical protein
VSYPVEDLQPGDFTITPVLDGFMIGRMIPQLGIGPWWTFIKIVSDKADALRHASTLALAEHTRAWLQEAPGRFQLVEVNKHTGEQPQLA